MITFNVSGNQVSIPNNWDEVTHGQYCEILKGHRDSASIIAMFTGIDCETVKKSTIIGLDDVLIALNFLNKVPIVPEEVTKIGPYYLKTRQNIQFESLALFEDMKVIAMKADPKKIVDFTERYATYVAMYLQRLRDGEYSHEKAMSMIDEVKGYPALQVISLGSFFFVKLGILLSGTTVRSRHTNQNLKKSKPVMKTSKKRSASTGRSQKSR